MYNLIKSIFCIPKTWIKIRVKGRYGGINIKADCMKHVVLLLINGYKENEELYKVMKQSIEDYEIFKHKTKDEIISEINCVCDGTREIAGQKCKNVSRQPPTISRKRSRVGNS